MVIAVDLNDRHGQKKIFYNAASQIKDLALAGDTLFVREEKTLSSLDLEKKGKPVSVDVEGSEGQILPIEDDLLLWHVNEERYLRLPKSLKR